MYIQKYKTTIKAKMEDKWILDIYFAPFYLLTYSFDLKRNLRTIVDCIHLVFIPQKRVETALLYCFQPDLVHLGLWNNWHFFFFCELNILKAQTWVNTHYLKRDTFLLLHTLITEYLHHKLTSVALIHFICPSDSVKSLKLQLSCGNYNLSSAGSLKLGIMMLSIKFRAPFAFRISML